MKTLKKQIPYILLGATLLLLLGLNIISQDHWLESDMARGEDFFGKRAGHYAS